MCGPTQTLLLQSQKMLASTVQFSMYNQTPATGPHQTHALPQETQRYEEQTGPAETKRTPVPRKPRSPGAVRSLRTQQRAYEPDPHHHPVPHATEVTPYQEQQQPPAELVSVPPSSSTLHATPATRD